MIIYIHVELLALQRLAGNYIRAAVRTGNMHEPLSRVD